MTGEYDREDVRQILCQISPIEKRGAISELRELRDRNRSGRRSRPICSYAGSLNRIASSVRRDQDGYPDVSVQGMRSCPDLETRGYDRSKHRTARREMASVRGVLRERIFMSRHGEQIKGHSGDRMVYAREDDGEETFQEGSCR